MGYFRLTAPLQVRRYPFDYHSHFSGILPVHGTTRPSLAKLMADALGVDAERGELALFRLALEFMIDPATNPFARLLARSVAGRVQYERAECAAENVYIAAVLLGARGYLPMDLLAAPAYAPELFAAVRDGIIDPPLSRTGEAPDARLLETVRYFNGKIFSANKYTPFDDCYKMRGGFVKLFCGGDPARYADWNDRQRHLYHAWIDATFASLSAEGIVCTQIAATEDEIPAIAARAAAYDAEHGTRYRLLVHTPHQYLGDGALAGYLESKVLPLLTGPGPAAVIGLDLLGAENKVGSYGELMTFLRAHEEALGARFGGGADARSRKLVVHVHCGEGSGFGADNRSTIGYLLHEAGYPGEAFFGAFAEYVLSCARAADARRGDTPRGTRGTRVPYGLFDELFRNNGLSWNGRALRRFDVTAARSREQAAFNAKRNVMALSEALDARPDASGQDWYRLLAGDDTPYAFRLGHAYHYRSYFAARYPRIAFDTNLGSNAITGASGLFGSVDGYRINRGFRQLDGYIDTGVLEAAGDAVAYMASEALTPEQVRLFARLAASERPLADAVEDARAEVEAQLAEALGPIYAEGAYFGRYLALVGTLAPGAGRTAALRYQILARLLALFGNWRSCLLGADGQGAEHTDIRREFLRMALLLAYGLLPTGHARVEVALLDELQQLLLDIGGDYWRMTVDPGLELAAGDSDLRLEAFDGFKAPDSVVTVRTATVVG